MGIGGSAILLIWSALIKFLNIRQTRNKSIELFQARGAHNSAGDRNKLRLL